MSGAVSPDLSARAWQRQNRVVELIATGALLADVLDEIVQLVEEQLPESICSILLLEPDGVRLRMGAGRRLPAVYTQAIDGLSTGPSAGSCGTAAYHRRPVVVSDIATDPLWDGYRELALPHGLRACWSYPILGQALAGEPSTVLGTFALYRNQVATPDPSWASTLAGAAHLAGVAIERVQALRALRDSEARYRLLADNAHDALFMHDAQGLVQDVNRRACESLGWSREELIGRSPFDFDPDLTHEQMRAIVERLDRSEPVAFESRHRRKDGSVFPVEIRLNAFVADGRRLGIAVVRDLSERKQAERDLRRHGAMLRRAQEMAQLTSWTYDLAHGTLVRSGDGSRVPGVGIAEGEAVHVVHGAVHPDDLARLQEAWQTALGGGSYAIEHRVVEGDEVRWLYVRAEAEEVCDGRPARIVGVTQDITARRRIEEQMAQAQKMEAIGMLAGGVAHDFNNLLTVICGHSELLIDSLAPDDPLRVDAVGIRDAGELAARLTGQLLAFSRRAMVEPRVLDLNDSIQSMSEMLRRLLGEDVEFVTRLDPGLVAVRADPGQIEQVLINLAVNARDAMPAGGRLTIGTRNVTAPESGAAPPDCPAGSYAGLVVTDTGAGMTDAVRAHIFEPFFTTKSLGRGTGLGLATVFGIVKQAGGSISVESAPGEGTTFTVLLPAVP